LAPGPWNEITYSHSLIQGLSGASRANPALAFTTRGMAVMRA
jgi:hypothetical protein